MKFVNTTSNAKRFLAIALAFTLVIATVAGCKQNSDTKPISTPQTSASKTLAYIPQYLLLPDGTENIADIYAADGAVYFAAQTGDGSALYKIASGSTDIAPLAAYSVQDGFAATAICVSGNNIWVAEASGDAGEYRVRKLDLSGTELANFPASSEVSGIALDKDGNVYTFGKTSGVTVYNAQGGTLFSLNDGITSLPQQLVSNPDGTVSAVVIKLNGPRLIQIDASAKSWGAETEIAAATAYYHAESKSAYLYSDVYSALNGYDAETKQSEKLLNWFDVDIQEGAITALTQSADGAIYCASSFGAANGKTKAELAVLTLTEVGALPDRTVLTLASFGSLMSGVSGQIAKFNKESAEYEIVVTEYEGMYSDDGTVNYSAINKFNLAIISGKTPDIMLINGLVPDHTYVSKGVFEDLYPYIDGDTELGGRGAFVQAPLRALETDGALYQISPLFYVTTLAAPQSVAQGRSSWTVDDALTLLAQCPAGTEAIANGTKEIALDYILLYGMTNFVNWETGECSFNSDGFTKLLEFAKSFPVDRRGTSFEDLMNLPDAYALVSEGKALTVEGGLSSFAAQMQNRLKLGEDFAYIGYPMSGGTGAAFSTYSQLVSMSSTSRHKEAAWQFIRSLLTKDYQVSQLGGYLSEFPLNKEAFDETARQEMTPGRVTPILNTPIDPVTQSDVDAATRYIDSVNMFWKTDPTLLTIIREEAAPYFAGQATAQEVAESVQRRALIYVSEQG